MGPRIAVIGAGALGAALAVHLARTGRPPALLATVFDGSAVDAHRRGEPHPAIACVLHRDVVVVDHDGWTPYVERAGALLLAVSGEGIVATARLAAEHAAPEALWIVATKAWDLASFKSAAALVADEVGDRNRVVAVAGPSLAGELARGESANVVCAGWSFEAARRAAALLESPVLRVDVSTDVEGVAICAVLKNVAAIALGFCESLNAKAALFSMALREMDALVAAVGGERETVLGPAGAGDLFVTCLGGRNARFGELVGGGVPPAAALEQIGSTVEGYGNARTVVALASHFGLDLRVMRAVASVLYDGAPPQTVAATISG